MQVANVATRVPTLRSEIDGWTFEDALLLVKRTHPPDSGKLCIGYTPAPKGIPFYTCVLEMLADGWELLGPPRREKLRSSGTLHEQWNWWLQRKLQP